MAEPVIPMASGQSLFEKYTAEFDGNTTKAAIGGESLLTNDLSRENSRIISDPLPALAGYNCNKGGGGSEEYKLKGAEAYTQPFLDFMTGNPTVFHTVAHFEEKLTKAGFKKVLCISTSNFALANSITVIGAQTMER
jgi:hypothetical protein